MKRIIIFCLLASVLLSNLHAKDTFNDYRGNAGHAEDISKFLTGKPYWSNSGNHALFPVLTGIAHIMYLTVDSTHRANPSIPMDDVIKATRYLQEHKKDLKIEKIPNLNEFLTPGGPYHGEYTHLGWDHIYTGETQQKWIIRKEILRNAIGKQFSFLPIIDNDKRNSLAALLYYVHILGDHEGNTLTTTRTRIPIRNLHEQDFISEERSIIVRWENNKNGIPETTIIAELNKHLDILFANKRSSDRYQRMMAGINNYLPEIHHNPQSLQEIEENQREKARWLLQILFSNVPYLLEEESFAKSFIKMLK